MKLKQIQLTNFRNLEREKISIDSRVNVFVGENGQGKSNILEAIHLLLTGDTFRPAKVEHFVRNNVEPQKAFVLAILEKSGVEHKVTLEVGGKKQFSLDQKRVSGAKLAQRFGTVMFSPESLQSIKGGPDQRRTMVDQAVASLIPQGAEIISDYKKALRSRNRLLKDHLDGKHTRERALELLESLNPTFLSLATDVTYLRIKTLLEIQPDMTNVMRDISGMNNVDTSVEYVISEKSYEIPDRNQILDALKQRALELKNVEIGVGNSLVGPHKHDIQVKFCGNDARFYCSQGQQRALILAFKIAQLLYYYRLRKARPILLLDDVFSELDERKRRYLVEMLGKMEVQTFITTTEFHEEDLFEGHSIKVFPIKNGHLRHQEMEYELG